MITFLKSKLIMLWIDSWWLKLTALILTIVSINESCRGKSNIIYWQIKIFLPKTVIAEVKPHW